MTRSYHKAIDWSKSYILSLDNSPGSDTRKWVVLGYLCQLAAAEKHLEKAFRDKDKASIELMKERKDDALEGLRTVYKASRDVG